MNKEHVCDYRCGCPLCGAQCHYAPRLGLHACSNVVNCRWVEKEYIPFIQPKNSTNSWAGMAEPADATDLKSGGLTIREGSTPSSRTNLLSDIVKACGPALDKLKKKMEE